MINRRDSRLGWNLVDLLKQLVDKEYIENPNSSQRPKTQRMPPSQRSLSSRRNGNNTQRQQQPRFLQDSQQNSQKRYLKEGREGETLPEDSRRDSRFPEMVFEREPSLTGGERTIVLSERMKKPRQRVVQTKAPNKNTKTLLMFENIQEKVNLYHVRSPQLTSGTNLHEDFLEESQQPLLDNLPNEVQEDFFLLQPMESGRDGETPTNQSPGLQKYHDAECFEDFPRKRKEFSQSLHWQMEIPSRLWFSFPQK